MNSPGTYRFTAPDRAGAAIATANVLKRGGHAIAVDEVFESDGKFLMATILHYTSCIQCQKEKSK